MGKKGYFATLFVLLLFVFFLFPIPTGEERYLVPERVIDLDNQSIFHHTADRDSGLYAFSLGDYFGYFSGNFRLSYSGIKNFGVAIGDLAFINYSKVPGILDIQNNNGEGRSIIETAGYPVIRDDRIVILSEDYISFYDLEGNLFWEKEILSFVTSLSITRGLVLIGYLDGSCELIADSGEVVLAYRPGGSRIEAIYSAAVSGDSQTVALIAGLDPQRFIILEKRKNEYKTVQHFELDAQYRRTVDMYFSSDNTEIFFENPEGVNVYNIFSQEFKTIGGSGRLENIYLDESSGFYSLLLNEGNRAVLKVLTPANRNLYEKEIPGEDFYFRKEGDNYYIGFDSKLMFLKMENG
ncbi:MAG: hypothetical protein JXR86_00040 [Spirochaetales bacterium]|nr:hypothetical protein [Spirochaetales bacterium]